MAWLALLAVQLISPDRAWSWLLAGLTFLLLVGYVWARAMRDRVRAGRWMTDSWVVAGDHLREVFFLHNAGWLPVLWARVRDRSDVPGYRVDRVETASPGERRTWSTAGICERRGVFTLGPWQLELSDPLGLFSVVQYYPTVTTMVVYPRASYLPQLELPRGRAPGRSSSSLRANLETDLVGDVRQHVAGEGLRRVHWRATAHMGKLMVREFDREPSGDLWLVVDLDASVQAGVGAQATQEYAVTLAASLAARYLREGERRAVGLALAGQHPVLLPPRRGQAQFWSILQALAAAEPAPGVSLESLLKQVASTIGGGRTLAVITPSQSPDWVATLLRIAARGTAPSVVLLDATTFKPPAGAPGDLLGLRTLLASQRIPSTVMEQGYSFTPLDSITREKMELKVLQGTGRVIRVAIEEQI